MTGTINPTWPTPDEIVEEFWRHSGRPTQRQLDLLTGAMRIPIMALAGSIDGADFPIAMFRVARDRDTFEFTDDEAVWPIPGFVAWGEDGAAEDLVAWSPRDNWIGTWLGRAAVLNAYVLDELQEGDRLRVYMNAADWLRDSRQGVVILDKMKAVRLLEGLILEAVDIAEGLQLRKLLERPRAKIVVPAARKPERAAA